jgi:hypothetical protein
MSRCYSLATKIRKRENPVSSATERKVAIGNGGQGRPFVEDSGDALRLEQIQQSEQFTGQEKVPVGILVKVILEVMQGVPRDGLQTDLAEVPVQERHHPVRMGHPKQMGLV